MFYVKVFDLNWEENEMKWNEIWLFCLIKFGLEVCLIIKFFSVFWFCLVVFNKFKKVKKEKYYDFFLDGLGMYVFEKIFFCKNIVFYVL